MSATPLTIEPRKRAFPSPSRPRETCFSRSARIAATASSTRAGVDVRDHDRHLEAAQEQRRELGGHQPGADDADLLDPPWLRLGDADALLDPPLDEVEGVHPGLRLRAGQEIGERVLLGGVALLDRPLGRAGDQVEGAVRGERDAVHGVVDGVARLGADLRRVGEVGGRSGCALLLDRADEPLDRVVEELDVVDELVGEPELDRLAGVQHPVLLQRIGDDQLDGCGGADEPRGELGSSPAGDDPEEDLGEADVAHRAGEGAEVAVERDLEPAAERRSVDRGERGIGQVTDRREGVVPRLGRRARELGRAHLGELGQVGADREDERLAGEHEPAPVSLLELRQELGERGERGPAEDVRLLPVLAVVDRDERDRADARLDLLEEELRLRRQPWRVFSHSRAAPMPRPMQSAVNP